MFEWLSQYTGELVFGAIFFVLSGVVSWWLFWLQKKRKTLDWELVTDESFTVAAKRLRPGLATTWNGVELRAPRVVTLQIFNSGREPIVADDYDRPITISFQSTTFESVKILDAVVSAASDPAVFELGSLKDDARQDLYDLPVVLKPRLLNPGDWIEIQLIMENMDGQFNVSSRFTGQSRRVMSTHWLARHRAGNIVLFILIYMLLAIAATFGIWPLPNLPNFSYRAGIVTGACVILLALILWRIARSLMRRSDQISARYRNTSERDRVRE